MRSQTTSLQRADADFDLEVRQEDHAPKALVAAILDSARDDLKRGRRVATEAREWFAERDPTLPWSFEWCCAILDLDPDAVRLQISANRDARHLPQP